MWLLSMSWFIISDDNKGKVINSDDANNNNESKLLFSPASHSSCFEWVSVIKMKQFLVFVIVMLFIGNFAAAEAKLCRCGRIYLPVCVSDGAENRTFDNECTFKCEQEERGRNGRQMTFKHDGSCRLNNEMWNLCDLKRKFFCNKKKINLFLSNFFHATFFIEKKIVKHENLKIFTK